MKIDPLSSALILWVDKDPCTQAYTPLTGIHIYGENRQEMQQFVNLVKATTDDWRDLTFFVFPISDTIVKDKSYIEVITSLLTQFEEREELFPDYFKMSGEELFCLY